MEDVERLLYTSEQAAAALGIGKTTVRKIIAEGKLSIVNVRGRVMIDREELRRYIRDNTVTRSAK